MMEVTANGKTFTFPDGTSAGDIGNSIDEYFAGQSTQDQQPTPAPEAVSNPAIEAAKGIAQTGANVLNIPIEIANAIKSAAAWVSGNDTYTPIPAAQLPESMQPKDEYAKLGAEIGPYLIPGVGAEKTAAALGSVAGSGRAERLATKAADMVAENTIGALAQNSSNNDAGSLAKDLSLGAAASGAARVVLPLAGKVANKVLGRSPAQVVDRVAPSQTVDNAVPVQALDNPPPASGVTVAPEQVATEDTLRKLAAQKNPELASSLQGLDVKPRQDVIDAASRLGVDELLPSHLSGNAQYQAVEQALKSRRGSALKVQEDEAIRSLAESTGKMIDDVAGAPDSLAMSEKFVGQMDSRMAALERKSDQLYARTDKAMPPGASVEAQNTAAHLERQADELGGWENLDPIEQRVFKAVNPGAEGRLTYANLNKQRRMVGQALYKKSGPYKDADEAALSRLYSQLAEDQRAVLGDVGARRDFEVAQRLVQMRKNMEDQMVSVRGRTLTGDATTKVSNALTAMAKGNGKQFRETMENIPSRQMRAEMVGAALRDMLSIGKRGSDFNPGGYADWYQNMRSSGQIRLLAKHIPRDLMKGLDDTYIVAKAIRDAKGHEINTGALNEFTSRFNRVTAAHEMVANHAGKVGTMIGAKGGPLGAVAGAALGEKLAQRARVAGGAGSADAAEQLIMSPAYQSAVKTLPKSAPAHVAETRIRRNPKWRAFYDSLPDKDKRTIARVGLAAWLRDMEETVNPPE
ncbi:Uncharacterised protein [Yersinia massiliensis]|uniref:hypothetical protein n=1 Tax=Yersinia massiliensis TaxID=419257 RepID=UPI0005E4B022|nr:hypothetical protein [Yersinia massiliensis]CNH80589.1 Uncharacterised protein [Yersinia massiliensis]